MPENIPGIDPDLIDTGKSDRNERLEELEFEVLQADAAARHDQSRDRRQRYFIKWVAIITGVVIIMGMSSFLGLFLYLTYAVHDTFWEQFFFTQSTLAIAMVIAPITSITAITVALFVGAFRRFEDKDMETASNGAAAGASFFRGG
jgi:magnesium-transporting ATPase (P-type)